MIINSKIEPAQAHTICFSIADHLPIITFYDRKKEKNIIIPENFKKINYEKLENVFKNLKIDDINKLKCNEAFSILHEKVIEKVEECKYEIPKKEIQKKYLDQSRMYQIRKGSN